MAPKPGGRAAYIAWRRQRRGHWAAVRYAVKVETDNRCQLCGIPHERLHVHHLSYANATNEDPMDPATLWHLTALCEPCHIKEHLEDPSWRWVRRSSH
jgi:5-methylcytosine-specific restriction endonuclease McrA